MTHSIRAVIFLTLTPFMGSCAMSVSAADSAIPSDQSTEIGAGVLCGGRRCSAGEFCCLRDGACRSDIAECRVNLTDAGSGGHDASEMRCASERECPAGYFCDADSCLGLGACLPRTGKTCVGVDFECGCDGTSYETRCARIRAGVRRAAMGRCGQPTAVPDAGRDVLSQTGCGTSQQCGEGQTCCSTTGRCVTTSCSQCCPPLGGDGVLRCFFNEHCTNGYRYCAAEGCAASGLCARRPLSLDCGGEVNPVCGCDNRTYSNPCWAGVAGTRVASQGACTR